MGLSEAFVVAEDYRAFQMRDNPCQEPEGFGLVRWKRSKTRGVARATAE